MNPFERKSIFVWEAHKIEGGDPGKIAARLAQAGFEAALIHVCDGVYPVATTTPALVKALRAAGLMVAGWGAVYGFSAGKEAQQAAAQTMDLELDGWAFDAESAWDGQKEVISNTLNLLNTYKIACPGKPVAWCWWQMPFNPQTGGTWHPADVCKTAMRYADIGMPMVYWGGSIPLNAVTYLQNSFRQWRQLTQKPIVPTGRAYVGDGGAPQAAAIKQFEARARELGCPGVTWWNMLQALAQPADVWQALADLPGFCGGPQPQPEPGKLSLESLDARVQHLEQLTGVK